MKNLSLNMYIRFFALICLFALIPGAVCSQANDYTFKKNVMVEMRDGVKLATNVFIPNGDGPFPVILMRSPYGKGDENGGNGKRFTSQGYVFVSQDCRGKFDSEGIWDPFRYDREDGFDTVKWVTQQSWCDGKIGTGGGSYVGFTQWSSAPETSPLLSCMLPVVPFSDAYLGTNYVHGAYQLALTMGWGTMVSFKPGETPPQIDWAKAYTHLPLQTWDDAVGKEIFYLRDWIKHSTYDDYWKQRSITSQYEDITVPILNIGGWYDIFAKIAIENIASVRQKSKDPMSRRNALCIIGPWGHGVNQTKVGDIDFGEASKIEMGKIEDAWYSYWLKGEQTEASNWPPYRLFVMGRNEWRSANEWPLPETVWTKVYLHSNGSANSSSGDGALRFESPSQQTTDEFTYDPENPVPTTGGNNLVGAPIGPFNQQDVEKRTDVLVYTTGPLDHDLEVTGPVTMTLFASSTATDTDFTAKLVDVHPDGKAYNICDGIIRARYRNSDTNLELIEPGTVYEYEIDLWVTSNEFKKGHCIRVEVSSSNFPRFDRNPNTGHEFGADTQLIKATQTIYHDAEHPSHIVLPVIPRK
ncbi:MAG: CocE/NonD family hydrolase [Candidatus Hinthialibacter antarcticus]|nr:CocE/NonD family hydrolase [Candidatus Hinthialibacter antarcticus]